MICSMSARLPFVLSFICSLIGNTEANLPDHLRDVTSMEI